MTGHDDLLALADVELLLDGVAIVHHRVQLCAVLVVEGRVFGPNPDGGAACIDQKLLQSKPPGNRQGPGQNLQQRQTI